MLSASAPAFALYRRRIAELKRANASQEEFSRRLIESQESECKRIAVELHDSLGQSPAIIRNHALTDIIACIKAVASPAENALTVLWPAVADVRADGRWKRHDAVNAQSPFPSPAIDPTRHVPTRATGSYAKKGFPGKLENSCETDSGNFQSQNRTLHCTQED